MAPAQRTQTTLLVLVAFATGALVAIALRPDKASGRVAGGSLRLERALDRLSERLEGWDPHTGMRARRNGRAQGPADEADEGRPEDRRAKDAAPRDRPLSDGTLGIASTRTLRSLITRPKAEDQVEQVARILAEKRTDMTDFHFWTYREILERFGRPDGVYTDGNDLRMQYNWSPDRESKDHLVFVFRRGMVVAVHR